MMVTAIELQLESVRLAGALSECAAARALAKRLPVRVVLQRWGDEYYGDLGASLGSLAGETVEVLEVGDLAYWEPGGALCVFFGPTPASRGDEPRAASPVYRVGKVAGDWGAVRALGPTVRARLSPRESLT